MLKSLGSRRMILEGSLSFNGRELEAKISLQTPVSSTDENVMVRSVSFVSGNVPDQLPAADSMSEKNVEKLFPEYGNQRHQAALKLQKTYKSFRTRRQLADCAVLVEQRWWELLDFAELKRSSISFFDIERPETAISRWSRARTRAAKIDPRHRYGHNLQFYYVSWLQCDSKQPFFYWLDIGEGKEVYLQRCPRSKLQQQCIKYLGPTERKAYEVIVKDGKFIYEQSGHLLDTKGGPKDVKWIFVLSVSKILYVGQKIKGTFQHSSFLAGGATLSAGRLEVEEGILKAVWPHSGHYLPTEENFEEFISFLKQHNVDLRVVQRAPNSDEEVSFGLCNSLSAPDFCQASEADSFKIADTEKIDSSKHYSKDTDIINPSLSRWSRKPSSKISKIQIPKREDMLELFKDEQCIGHSCSTQSVESPDGYKMAEEYLSDSEFSVSKENLFDEDQQEGYEEPIPKEKIMKRINSHKGLKSYQLAKQLSCKWTTGAGPRIGCVRDYPSELQLRVLEEVNLSPRSTFSSPRRTARPILGGLNSSPLCRETTTGRSPFAFELPKLAQMAADNQN
ncbi:calmodulin-binding family protein [Abeliophyllum distichum]|uniref:Calmodulin-binding family protein n=1 Tax=Abeliophyllum distichum TaxID=126358 RepID=A0ABD1VCW0_9LAMI